MVNKIGGKNYKKKKKGNSRFLKKKKLIDNITDNSDYVIGKVIEKHNKDHFNILTMDKNSKLVYCSTQKSTVSPVDFFGMNETPIYTLLFKPQPKINKEVTKFESIILCVLTDEEIDNLITKYNFEFEVQAQQTFDESFISFKEDNTTGEKEDDDKEEDTNEIVFDIDDI